MNRKLYNEFIQFKEQFSESEQEILEAFYKRFNQHCLISKEETRKIFSDFERAILYYLENGFSMTKAIGLLDPSYLGGFYARPSLLWFSLDDSAKIYPMSLEHDSMPVFRLSAYMASDIVPELLQMALTFTIKRRISGLLILLSLVPWQCHIFPGRLQPSIFCDEKLNFCVRDGYRWTFSLLSPGMVQSL